MTDYQTIDSLRHWKLCFLKRKKLDVPDKRPLYSYRVSKKEFEQLEELLRNWLERFRQRYGYEAPLLSFGFQDLFVLYCAEWWQRRYSGDGFKWEPILAALGIPSNSHTQQQRSKCVEEGLKSWGLSLSKTGGHTYIGSVASQGGLPIKLLATARGGIGTLIKRVLHHAKATSVSTQDIYGWVESLEYLLPKSFRQPAIFTLITEISWTLLYLKEKAGLNAASNPINELDQKIPEWRERFPFPFEDDLAQGLIEQLVKEAASIRPQRTKLTLPVERTLEQHENNWKLYSSIEIPEIIKDKDLIDLFKLEDEILPRAAELTILAGDCQVTMSLRRLAGRESYRVSNIPLEFSGAQSTCEHLLRLTSADGRLWTASSPRGSSLEYELPWLFAEEDTLHRFVRQGGGSVAKQSAVVAVSQGWRVHAVNEQSSIEFVGKIDALERVAYSFRGLIHAEDENGNTYILRTGNAGETDESYEWVGRRLWYDLRGLSMSFRGTPALYIVDDEGSKWKVSGEPKFTAIGSRDSARYGPVEVRYPATGEIKHRSRMLILPETAQLQLAPTDARSGRIIFDGWKASVVRTVTPGTSFEQVKSDGALTLSVSVQPDAKTPETIDLEVFWSHTPTPVAVRVPFPASGVRGFDRNGRELRPFEQLAVQDLLGARLYVMGLKSGTKVKLILKAANRDIQRRYDIRSVEGSLTTEIRLADYRREIDYLHTIDDNPDSIVILQVAVDGAPIYRLNILSYPVRPERDEVKFWIESDSGSLDGIIASTVHAYALPLERPGEEPILLERFEEESVSRIIWNFFPEDREDGAWLIYPPKDASVQFRPMLWSVGGESDSDSESSYVRAITIRERAARESALDEFIESIVEDFDDPGWIEVIQLAKQVGHLPLSTIDLWRRFARSSKAMAALALRFDSFQIDFLAKFDNELPFSWETVAFKHWKKASSNLDQQIRTLFGDENGPNIFRMFIRSRVAGLVAECSALAYLLNIVLADYLQDSTNKDDLVFQKELADLKSYPSEFVLFGDRRTRDSSLLMKLLTGQDPEEEWPVLSIDLLTTAKSEKTISRYLCPHSYGVKDSVINLPLVLATQVVSGKSEDWFSDPKRASILHDFRSFDPDWFDEAFNLTIARCFADGLFD